MHVHRHSQAQIPDLESSSKRSVLNVLLQWSFLMLLQWATHANCKPDATLENSHSGLLDTGGG